MKLFKNSSSFGALLAASVIFSPNFANASDIFDGRLNQDSDQPVVSNPFAGFYVGAQVGGEFANLDIEDQFDGLGADGLIGGVHGGYNFALGNFVTGPYIEASWSNVDLNAGGVDLLYQEWYAQGGWIAGLNVSNASLVYVKAAYEFQQWNSDAGKLDGDVQAFVLGGGIDTMLTGNTSIGVFADYIIPHKIEANSVDITDMLEQSEAMRAGLKLTIRQ
jgi:hypothetical protein